MRKLRDSKETSDSSLNKKLEHVVPSEGLSYLEVQLISCRALRSLDVMAW